MKKLLTVLLALSILFTLTACGDDKTANSSNDNSTESVSSEIVEDTTPSDESTTTSDISSTNNSYTGTTVNSNTTPTVSSQPTTTSTKPSGSGTVNPSSVKLEKEYVGKVYFQYNATDIYAPGICFYNDGGYGEGVYCLLLDAMFTSQPDDDIKSRTPVTYNGVKYYRCGSGMSPAYVTMSSSEITITQDSTEIKAVLLSDGNLKITKSNHATFPVNAVLSIDWNYLSQYKTKKDLA